MQQNYYKMIKQNKSFKKRNNDVLVFYFNLAVLKVCRNLTKKCNHSNHHVYNKIYCVYYKTEQK